MLSDDEDAALVSAKNVQRILLARQRAEQDAVRTQETLEEETRILELLNQTGAALASKLDLQSLVQAVTDAATQLSGAQFGAFFYTATNDEGDVFTLYALSGAPREAFEKFGQPRATGLFGPTFRGEGVIRSGNVRQDARYGQMGPHKGMPEGHLPVCSYLAVPVIAQSGEVLGALLFGHEKCDVFTERAERLIVGVAAQAAIAIDNARLYESAKRSAAERASLLEAERKARAEVERVSLLKDEFLATLSHELRTPLNAILGWSELLLSRAAGNPNLQRGLEIITRNARAQAQLIGDLLDMNRIVSGKIRLEVQQIDLVPVVEAALDTVRPTADAKSIALRANLDPTGAVFGDPDRLQQVVWNLVTNAVKFTPQDGWVEVTLQDVSSHVVLTVRDSGIGIDPEFLPQMFERFRQQNSSTTRKYGGLGLGLSIVKQLVEMHGGRVNAESAGNGQGATFTITLPMRTVGEVTAPERARPISNRPLAAPEVEVSLVGVRVLVVDDEADARDVVTTMLTHSHAIVLTAESAEQGLALLVSERPDVIVSDIGMPARDGYDFIRDVRKLGDDSGGRTPAIALTAFARAEDRSRALLAGYQVHVSKPIERQQLLTAVHGLVAP